MLLSKLIVICFLLFEMKSISKYSHITTISISQILVRRKNAGIFLTEQIKDNIINRKLLKCNAFQIVGVLTD